MNPPVDRHPGDRPGANSGAPSPNFRYLCERAWRLGHGTICGLHVRAGDPHLVPPPIVIRMARCEPAKSESDEQSDAAFKWKPGHFAFRQQLTAIGDGVIDVIKVHDRVPVCLEMREEF